MGAKQTRTIIDFTECPNGPAWYVVVTGFNYEKRFVESFSEKLTSLENTDVAKDVSDIYVPFYEYDRIEKKNGKEKKRHVTYKALPLYVFVRCKMSEKLFWTIRNSEGCIMLLASGSTLNTMTDEEIIKMKNVVKESAELSEKDLKQKEKLKWSK